MTLNIRSWLAKSLGYQFNSPNTNGGLQFVEMQMPPGWGYQSYLKAYGEIGWLYACCNVIAQAVAKTQWHLYELDAKGERQEVFQHEAIDFLNHINPVQTRYQFFYMATLYKKLVGEEFWALNFNKGGLPAEMWLAPPAYMSVVPGTTNYIDRYEYRRNNAKIDFDPKEIIHIMSPNPNNPYRGISEAQALTVDLDSQRYAGRYNQKVFFNDATPGFMIEYPADGMPPSETRKELMEEWDERYRGFRNRGKTAFLWGGKASTITMNNRDMDFANLLDKGRDMILATYKVPFSVLGMKGANRAEAEAGQYAFGMYCIDPELTQLREAMNKELLPLFGDNLYLDYDSPIPEDENSKVLNTSTMFKAGYITRNEARVATGFEPIDTPDGEEFFTQPSQFGAPANEKPTQPGPKSYKRKAILTTETEREAFHKEYVSRAEGYEAKTIHGLQTMFLDLRNEALSKMRTADANTVLIDPHTSKQAYIKLMIPILTQVTAGALQNGRNLVDPPNPHKDGPQDTPIPVVVNQAGLKWLKTRINWAADQIGEESASRLSKVLQDGFARGDSIDQITRAIEAEFDFFSDVRAERIARTEIMASSYVGTIEGYKDTGVVSKVEFMAAKDEKECPLCDTLDGQVFTIGDEAQIPVHVACRCVYLPKLD